MAVLGDKEFKVGFHPVGKVLAVATAAIKSYLCGKDPSAAICK